MEKPLWEWQDLLLVQRLPRELRIAGDLRPEVAEDLLVHGTENGRDVHIAATEGL